MFFAPSPPACESLGAGSFEPNLKKFEVRGPEQILPMAAAVFLLTTLTRMVVFEFVLERLAAVACGSDAKLRRKFREAAWRACIYAAACTFAVSAFVLVEEQPGWLHDSELFWKGWPDHELAPSIQYLYALYFGFYIHQMMFLFIDTRSSDFVALVVHHLITLTICGASWALSFYRIGAFTMVLHDFSDIFLELAKCFNYTKDQHPRFSKGADVAFVVFAVSFFYLRLYIYPTRVLTSAATEACEHLICFPSATSPMTIASPDYISKCVLTRTFMLFLPLLGALQLLQIFWGWKVVGVVATVISGRELEDPRDE